MSILAEFTVPTEAFVLAEAFAAAPEVTVELEQVVPTAQRAFPLVFAWGGADFAAFEEAARTDPAIATLTRIETLADGRIYRAEWTGRAKACRDLLLETGAVLLQAEGTEEEWWLELRFANADQVAAFQEAARTGTCRSSCRSWPSMRRSGAGQCMD